MDCMILMGAFTSFYLAAVIGSDGAGASVCHVGAGSGAGGWSTAEEVAAAAAHLSDEEKLRLMRLLY